MRWERIGLAMVLISMVLLVLYPPIKPEIDLVDGMAIWVVYGLTTMAVR